MDKWAFRGLVCVMAGFGMYAAFHLGASIQRRQLVDIDSHAIHRDGLAIGWRQCVDVMSEGIATRLLREGDPSHVFRYGDTIYVVRGER